MRYQSAFEIIGPIMVGPSSSHTAGAVRIGNLARQILNEDPKKVEFRLMGSFAETYQGHGTDVALIAGILGLPTDDPNIPNAPALAAECGLQCEFKKVNLGFFHPNTVAIDIQGEHRHTRLIASSLGGGKVEVQELDDLPLKFTGEKPTLILYHKDEPGFLGQIAQTLSREGHNIARLTLERWEKSGSAITVCELDSEPTLETLRVLGESVSCLKELKVVHID